MYGQELHANGLEPTQFTLLMALEGVREMTQGELGKILAIDSTTLTRTLRLLLKRGFIRAIPGDDRRERHLSLTSEGRQKLQCARPDWERAQRRLKRALGDAKWRQLGRILAEVTQAAM
jgi:DNA-binding MarR family transcriptional regulator